MRENTSTVFCAHGKSIAIRNTMFAGLCLCLEEVQRRTVLCVHSLYESVILNNVSPSIMRPMLQLVCYFSSTDESPDERPRLDGSTQL